MSWRVIVRVSGLEMGPVITRSSVESLALKVGSEVTVVIKSTEVLLARD